MPKERRDTANKWGLQLGVGLGIVIALRSVLLSQAAGLAAGPQLIVSVVYLLGLAGIPFAAGLLSAHDVGKVGPGVYGGFLAGLVGGILSGVATLVITTFWPSLAISMIDLGTAQGMTLCAIPVFAILGAIMGLLGGVVGRLLTPKAPRTSARAG
jgi:hypothetical protein